jgi:class 3 adenylate cyclase
MIDLDSISTPTELDVLVAFTDLTLFSRYAKTCSARELFDTISAYYEVVGRVVTDTGGKVVKFIGDTALVAFPDGDIDRGVDALLAVKENGDSWLAQREIPCRHYIRAHFGPVVCGPVGTRSEKRFDLFGETVNLAATLSSRGFAMTPQVFRKLQKEKRKLFKKHTPPITYIPVEESHRD